MACIIELTSFLFSSDDPVVLVCGGKGSGKSTTNRFLMNASFDM